MFTQWGISRGLIFYCHVQAFCTKHLLYLQMNVSITDDSVHNVQAFSSLIKDYMFLKNYGRVNSSWWRTLYRSEFVIKSEIMFIYLNINTVRLFNMLHQHIVTNCDLEIMKLIKFHNGRLYSLKLLYPCLSATVHKQSVRCTNAGLSSYTWLQANVHSRDAHACTLLASIDTRGGNSANWLDPLRGKVLNKETAWMAHSWGWGGGVKEICGG